METIKHTDHKGPVQTDECVWMCIEDYLDEHDIEEIPDYIAVAEPREMRKPDAGEYLDWVSEKDDLMHDNADDIYDIWGKSAVEELQALLESWWIKNKTVNCYEESRTRRVEFDKEVLKGRSIGS